MVSRFCRSGETEYGFGYSDIVIGKCGGQRASWSNNIRYAKGVTLGVAILNRARLGKFEELLV